MATIQCTELWRYTAASKLNAKVRPHTTTTTIALQIPVFPTVSDIEPICITNTILAFYTGTNPSAVCSGFCLILIGIIETKTVTNSQRVKIPESKMSLARSQQQLAQLMSAQRPFAPCEGIFTLLECRKLRPTGKHGIQTIHPHSDKHTQSPTNTQRHKHGHSAMPSVVS